MHKKHPHAKKRFFACADRGAQLVQKDKSDVLRFALCGAAAGLVNGFFGGGGGQVLIPLLTRRCGVEEKTAFATCVAIIAPLCAAAGAGYLLRGAVTLSAAWPYLLGGAAGGFIAGKTFKKLSGTFLRRLLALLILYGGVKSLFWS